MRRAPACTGRTHCHKGSLKIEIRLDNLTRTYTAASSSNVHAVNGVSLSIPSNTIFGIIGKSGAGKSTLIRLMSLLERPDSGAVYYDGERVDNLTGNALIQRRRRLGMIFQNFNLFGSRTAGQNIAYPMEICGVPKKKIASRVSELLEIVGLADRAQAPISTLSGGQKQRIAIARSLANNPDVLFCDEATSALDPQTTRSILDLIRTIQKEMRLTVVMITHQMEVVRDACDYLAVIDGGKIAEQGRVSDVFTHPQCEVTKDFLSHLAPMLTENEYYEKGMVRWSQDGGHYTFHFTDAMTDEPVLSNLAKRFDVDLNIRAGGIQRLHDHDVGSLILDISGSKEEIERALEYVRAQGVIVEES